MGYAIPESNFLVMAFRSDAAERPVDTRAAPLQGNQGDTDEAFAHPESANLKGTGCAIYAGRQRSKI